MSQDGYTLAETMAALVMIGLAIGGLSQATYLIGRFNHATSAQVAMDRHTRDAQRALDGLLVQAGPFRARDDEGFRGRGASFVFPCDPARLCGAELVTGRDQTLLVIHRGGRATASRPLGRLQNPRFAYRDGAGLHDTWPLSQAHDDGKRTLEAVALVEGQGGDTQPVAVAAVWARQPAACQLDPNTGDFREMSP